MSKVTTDFAIEYLLDGCDDCPEKAEDNECISQSHCFEVKRMAIQALKQMDALDKIRAEIEMYEADCRLQGGTDECEECNCNVFGSVYRIIDKYKAEEEYTRRKALEYENYVLKQNMQALK